MARAQALSAAFLSEPLRRVASGSLLGQARELVIVHNGREYRLRLTRNGKLILTA
jgi:hemin uptake protein HemP